MKKLILFLILTGILYIPKSFAQLSAGDIAIIGYNTDSGTGTTDDFSFITLTDIPGSEVIYFTEEGWNTVGAGSWAGTSEGHLEYTAPSGGLPCGTVVHINESSANTFTIGSSVSGATITLESGSSWSLTGGDQVLVYQAASAEPTTTPTFITGINGDDGNGTPTALDMSTSWNDPTVAALGTARSALPTGLTNGVNCIALFNSVGSEVDNARYTGTLTGTSTVLRASINDTTNWTKNDGSRFDISFGSYSPSVTCSAPAQTVTSVSVPANTTYTVGQNLDFTVTFSGNITVVTTGGTPQIAITIGSTTQQAAYVSGSGSTNLVFRYTVQNGDLDTDGIAVSTLTANGGTLQDGAGTDADLTLNSVGSTAAVLVDAAGPTVTTVSIPNSPANVGDAITVIIVADESGLTLNTGQVNGVNVTGFTNIAGNTYSATYTVAEGNTDRAAGDNIPVNFILTDALSNNSATFTTAISQNADAIDANTPTITSVSIPNSAANVGDAVTVTIIASESGLSLNTGQVNGVNVTGFSDDGGGSYSATYTVAEGNTDRAAGDDIPVNFILSDATGNNSAAFTTAIAQASDPIDANSPSVTSASIPNVSAKVGDAITVSITAGESGLSLNTGQVNGVNITGFSDDGGGSYSATYTVAEGNTDRAAGDDIPVNFMLTDASGNNSVAFTTAISQASDPIDANSPSVTSASIPNASAKVGDAITVSITAGESGLSLNTGQVNGVNVTGFSDDGGGSYSATYTVAEGNTDRAAGDDIPVNLMLTDASGNNSVAFTTAISQASDPIDANTPTITSVSVPANATYTSAQNLDFTVNFSESITVNTTGGTPQITLTIGSTTRQATYQSGSGTSALLFRYIVQAGDLDTDGIVVGSLSNNMGTLKDTSGNDANLTLNSVGSTVSILVGNPTITWTGTMSNDWATAGNWNTNSLPTAASDVIIPNTGITNYPTISSAVTVNSINIASGASLIANAAVTTTDKVTYSRNLPTTNWYLVSAPVSGENSQDVINNHSFATGSGANIGIGAFLNSGSNAWRYFDSSTNESIVPGYGVSMKLNAPGDVSITGDLITTNYGLPVSTGTRNNFNLLGNPYTCYFNSAGLASDNSVINNSTFWFWNGTQYVTHNAANPIEIAPAQGFFIEANAIDNIIFFTNKQSHQSSDTFMREAPKTSFELFVESGDDKTSTQVFYIDGKTTGHDYGYDSKMFGGTTYDFAVFTELLSDNEGKKLAIQTLPNENHSSMVIPVGLIANAGKEINFSISAENLPAGIEIYLEDRVNNTFTNLSTENFKVTLKNNTEGAGQFYIHTSSKSLSADDIVKNISEISIYKSSERTVTLSGLQGEATIKVYSLLGEELVTKKLNSNGNSKIELPNLSTGIYVVRLNSKLGTISKKIILE